MLVFVFGRLLAVIHLGSCNEEVSSIWDKCDMTLTYGNPILKTHHGFHTITKRSLQDVTNLSEE